MANYIDAGGGGGQQQGDDPGGNEPDIDLGAIRGVLDNNQSTGGNGIDLNTAGTRTDLGPGNMPDNRGRLSPAADFVGGITTDAAASTASGIENVQESPAGDFAAGFAAGVRGVTDSVKENAVDPAAGVFGRVVEIQAQLEQARDPRVPTDNTTVSDVAGGDQTDNLANPQTKSGRIGERAAGGFGDTVVSIPEDVLSAGAASAELTEAGAETIAAEGPVEGTQEIGDAARAGAVAAAGQTAKYARENPARFTGGVAGGIFGGTAFTRGAETAIKAGRIQRRTDRQSDPVDFEDITSDKGAEGELPEFDTPRNAPTEQAVQEVTERATDNPDALKDRLDTDMVTFRSESERLPGDLDAQPGESELPGLFTAPDASPLRADVTDSGGGGFRLPFTKGATKPETFSAFELEDVRGIPDRAAGSGRVSGDNPGLDSPSGRFLAQEADRGPGYVRATGDRTTELESIFAPGTAFERIGAARVENVGGTLDLFQRADARDTTDIDFDKPPAARGDGDTSFYSPDEIRARERASRTDGEPVSPTPATPATPGGGSGGGSTASGGSSSGGGPIPTRGNGGGSGTGSGSSGGFGTGTGNGSGGSSSGGGPIPTRGNGGGSGTGSGGSGSGTGSGSGGSSSGGGPIPTRGNGSGTGTGSSGGGGSGSSGIFGVSGSSGGGGSGSSGGGGSYGSGGGSTGGFNGGGSGGGYGGGTPPAPGAPKRPPQLDDPNDDREEELLFTQGTTGERFVNPIERLGDPDAGPDLGEPPNLGDTPDLGNPPQTWGGGSGFAGGNPGGQAPQTPPQTADSTQTGGGGADWHTRMEKELIRDFGGTPKERFGADGTINGEPTEVRLAKTEDRFRINQDTHQTLMEESGTYIFDDVNDNQPPKQVPAERVDDKLPDGDFHSDRGYMHKFLDVDSIF